MSAVRVHFPQVLCLFQILVVWLCSTQAFGQDKRPDWPAAQDLKESWQSLPPADEGNGTPLPTWARMLARSLPHTTAALLELEYLYRMEPLTLDASIAPTIKPAANGSHLAGVARYAVASYHKSAYGSGSAIADLKREKAHALIELMEAIRYRESYCPTGKWRLVQFFERRASVLSVCKEVDRRSYFDRPKRFAEYT